MKTLKQLWFHRREKKKNKKKKTKVVSFPVEIVEDILSRLPVKSILRCRSVSKSWLNLISSPSFNKLQFTRAHRTGLIFYAFHYHTNERHYLTAANDGGPLTLLMTVDDVTCLDLTNTSHLNGLICFTSRTWKSNSRIPGIKSHAFIVNPATRKVFQLPDMNSPSDEYKLSGYLYGFDESVNEHKILLSKKVYKTEATEFMIYSLSNYSWKTIDAEPPVGFDWYRLGGGFDAGVCVNSVVYFMHNDLSISILAFDFVTEKFSVISLPQDFFPDNDEEGFRKLYRHTITKIDECLGVVLHDWEKSEVRIWLLQDYHKCLWVKETIKLPKSWNDLAATARYPLTIDINMEGDILFSLSKVTNNVMIIPVYNRKSKCLKTLHFTLDDQFASLKYVKIHHIRCYVENIMPLVDNWSKTSHGQSD